MSRTRPLLAFLVLFLVACACACGPSFTTMPFGALALSDAAADDPGFAPEGGGARADAPFRADVLTDPGELPTLKVVSDDLKPLPLQHTDVKATVAGFVADVRVQQTYANPYDKVIEATYVFPLPENAAVYSMKLVAGDRVIEAVVKERQAARDEYEAARSAGYTAALLEQERPNVFTQSVANIAPGTKIDVVVQYVQDMTYDAGEYEFVFPMVVGPRYFPGEPLDGPSSGTGSAPDTTRVQDASRISPAVLGKGTRGGHDISLEVTASTDGAVSRFDVPTHDVQTETLSGGALRVRLSDKDAIPNRDFVLRYRVAGEKPKATLYADGAKEGYFSLVVQPPSLDVEAAVGKRELVFVVDVSGSMNGTPLAHCKAALRLALAQMRPVDTFNVLRFSGDTGKVFPRPRPANDASIREALQYIDGLRAGGGTELRDAVAEALSPTVEKGRHRYVFFLTDGFVGNEEEILDATGTFVSAIEAAGQRARVFGFGVGSGPNSLLIEGLAKRGNGVSVYSRAREDAARAVNQFYRYIDRSVLRDVKVDFGAMDASERMPAELPDLFASRPLLVHGRFKGSLNGPVVVRAMGPKGPVEIPVTVARAPAADGWPMLDLLWARAKVDWLEPALLDSLGYDVARKEITRLGVEHHLLTAFTSFVAVDRSRKVGDGDPVHVDQPAHAPEGVDAEAAGARVLTLDAVPAAPAAPGDGVGYSFADDPLASGGFGPNDATIRVGDPRATANVDRNKLNAKIFAAQQVSPGPRGCNCDVAGTAPLDLHALLPALSLAGLLLARRRRRARKRASKRDVAGAGRGFDPSNF
ncbi:MAG: VIT domain-containing protein [Polyangiaceae bacterium]